MKQTRDMKTLQLILLALITVPVCGAQTYAIRFSTSPPVGQIFGVTASGSMHQDISRGANVLNTMEYHVDFQGSAEVLEIDSIKTSFTVERFTMTTDGTTVELLKPRNVIIADGGRQAPAGSHGCGDDAAADGSDTNAVLVPA